MLSKLNGFFTKGLRLFALLLLSCTASVGLNAQGEKIYDDKVIHEIRFTSLEAGTWDKVIKNKEDENKDYIPVRIDIDGTTLEKVGLRIKGNRLNKFPNRPKFESLKVDINEYEKKQEYDGLKKLNIKNRNVVANHLLYGLARKLNVPSCRTALCKVFFDEEYVGSYLLIEQIDKTYLKQHFKNKKGNLYKASGKGGTLKYIGEDPKQYEYAYEKKTNEKKPDYSDLIGLLKLFSQGSSAEFTKDVAKKLDLKPFLKALAIEMLVNKRDAFYDAGRNYYLYNNPEDKLFHYIVDDFDYTFSDKGEYTDLNFKRVQSDVQPFVGSPLIDQILKSDEIKQQYYAAVSEVIKEFKGLNKELDRLEALTKGTNFKLYDHMDFQNNTSTIKAFIEKRAKEIGEQLKAEGYKPTAVETLSQSTMTVYPTNFKNSLSISSANSQGLIKYTLFDTMGHRVAKGSCPANGEIKGLGYLPKGLYILELRSGNQTSTYKLMK